ncbi:4Fe-4S dicluster domain-containing protein [Flaviflexus salsibiostraticola]|uniref:4Fe-4S dicluster domain-containing protein n=2 Tax=Flaviflexus salsibiostraticola TaxID=1282737 RepID=A0A3S8ZC66_9ACTO|nr:4Fe-4S dicluster domain-containing protein [Flaviflexus salsibiostraticola]
MTRMGTSAPDRLTPVGPRLWRVVKETLSHEQFKHRPWVRAAHWVVMLSFPILAFTLITAFFQLADPGWTMPVLGDFAPWGWLVEAFAWAGLIGGIHLTLVRTRTGRRGEPTDVLETGDGFPTTSRFFGSVNWQARYVEFTIVGVVACVIIIRGADYAYLGGDVIDFPLTFWIGSLMGGLSQAALGWIITIVSALKLAMSLAWLVVIGLVPSMGVAWHRFLALVNVYAQTNADGGPALGPLPDLYVDGTPLRMDSVEDLDEDATLGISTVSDISWKGLLDTATCTECGRCQDLCPAWNSAKPLSPKLLVTTVRDHAFASAPFAKAAASLEDVHSGDLLGALLDADAIGEHIERTPDAPLMPNVVTPDVLWGCTMCGACVDQCPVDIEHLDLIIGLRRNQVLMESAFPAELGKMFTGMENKGNPWGLNPRKRLDWAKGLDFEVPQVGVDVESAADVDYLFWVGCAGAFDDRAKKTSAAVAELLHTAGVSFAVLGDGESCTGDPARRAGNEVLFQMLAEQNIETLNEVGATKIVVSCAHCFNTIAKEYPQLGGHYTVLHHTQLLNRLVRDGRLTPVPPSEEERKTITYHDPCFLGRHNNIYSPPRELLGDVREMELTRERAMCCGAGGAHAFFEDKNGEPISAMRTRQAMATGAEVIATACPFCTTMLNDGVRGEGADIEVKDVSLLLLEGVRRGQES